MPRVLVVDDDQDFYFLVQTVLGRHGYDTINATDGNEALAIVSKEKFDVIVMDKVMPGIDGFEVARRIKQEPRLAGLPILIVSGAANPDDKTEAFEAGADDYLTKPFSIDELAARVSAMVERSEALAASRRAEAGPVKEATLIAVHTLRGGLGSSSIATNLALGFRQLWQLPTMLVDMAMVYGQVALLLNAPLRKSWSDVAKLTENDIDDAALYDIVSTHISGLKFLTSPRTPIGAGELSPAKISRAIAVLRASSDYLVADLVHDFSETSQIALNAAERIILVLAPDIVSVRAAAVALNTYASLGVPEQKVVLVLNQPYPQIEMTPAQIEDALRQSIFLVIPHEPRIFTGALNSGKPFLLEEPDEQVSALLVDLAFRLSKDDHQAAPLSPPSETWRKLARRLKFHEDGRPRTGTLQALRDWFR